MEAAGSIGAEEKASGADTPCPLCEIVNVAFPVVIVPVRAAPELAATLKRIVLFPVPEAGPAKVIQFAVVATFQAQTLAVEMMKEPGHPAAVKFCDVGVRAKLQGAAGVMVTGMPLDL